MFNKALSSKVENIGHKVHSWVIEEKYLFSSKSEFVLSNSDDGKSQICVETMFQ